MALLASGNSANIVLQSNESLRVSTGGSARVEPQYGAPAGDTTITAATQTFGPYGVPAKLILRALSGGADYLVVEDVASSSGGGHTIEEEGVSVAQRANMNFVGEGATAADSGGKTQVSIPGFAAIDGFSAGDGTAVATVGARQGGVSKKIDLRPSNWITSWANLLAIASPQQGDVHYLAPGVLGNMRPVPAMYDGTRWVPTGLIEWNLGNLIATRTTAGLFALTAGGSTALCPMPANLLRNGSHAEGEIVFGRNTASGTDSIAVRLMLGTTPSLVIGTDNMASTSPEGRFKFGFDFRGGQDGYSTFFSGFGNNQPLCASVSNAQINLAADMAFGLDLGATPTGSTFSIEMFNVKLSV